MGLAYRMLSSRTEAEDVLQDAWLRFSAAKNVENAEAFLVTTVTRLCLDRLKSARVRREIYVGPWLPEPVFDAEALSPHAATELADDLSFALLLTLERLTPIERGAFLLHDVFGVPFGEVARTLKRSEQACRQIASRARKAVREGCPRREADDATRMRLLAAFMDAVASGDVARLTALLRADALALTDGGGAKGAALNPIRGADKVARFFIGLMRKHGAERLLVEPRIINGALGLVVFLDGALDQTLSIETDGEQIIAVYAVRNPEKLAGLM